MRCPTCRAEQDWSDTCRRCKSDLRLLRRLAAACGRSRAQVLEHLNANRPAEALRAAEQLCLLSRDSSTERLLAVCQLLCGQYDQALRIADSLCGKNS